MEKLSWNDSYLLGITEIDLQHKKLLSLADDMYEIVNGDEDSLKVNLSKVLKSLTDYTVYHFSNEEEFMKKYGYPSADMHKSMHDNFIAEVTKQIKSLNTATKAEAERLYKFLASWVLNHIAKSDKVWAEYVKPNLK
ncbi:MAG: hemerythrin family protein [Spirochaetes bacterium]|uniref:Hemerythrin family protein n=1 Tax=Candidatus Gallitreponema excrementavium TaxID=2840840 RepID=A0A9D9N2I3_9SPIR|nr:hemerythrin family protein [Candidatus Gallitreponema excrementavium]